ncbi:MAG: NifU family protein [Patescibacteria group bacterium]|jgi:Fe-S cluster biogenesis protein NfuA
MPKLNIKPSSKAKLKIKRPIKTESKLEKLNKILDRVRPALERDGGNLELINFDEKNGLVEITFQGACAHCSLADVTLKHLIESEIRAQMPEIKEVRSI